MTSRPSTLKKSQRMCYTVLPPFCAGLPVRVWRGALFTCITLIADRTTCTVDLRIWIYRYSSCSGPNRTCFRYPLTNWSKARALQLLNTAHDHNRQFGRTLLDTKARTFDAGYTSLLESWDFQDKTRLGSWFHPFLVQCHPSRSACNQVLHFQDRTRALGWNGSLLTAFPPRSQFD